MSEMFKAEARTEPIDSTLEPAAENGREKKVEEASLWVDAWRSLRKNPWFIISAALLLIFLTMAIFPQLFTNNDPRECLLSRSRQDPSGEHWFGTDIQGCDYYSRVIYGARNSIAVGFIVAIGTFIIAVAVGLVAGFFGGWVDAVLSRITDMVFAVPYILGALVFLNALPSDVRGVREVSLVLIVFMWPTMTRLMRGSVISVAHSEYVLAARALGAGPITIMRRHILPNSLGPVIGYATVFTGIIIGAEATLTFLGVGLQLPSISWGLQLSDAKDFLQVAPHLLLFPVIFVGLTVFAFMTMGDVIRDAIDPKAKK
ncbi:ABC transporter permease [Nesterenkonia lutea]|uniref:Peptide/nickel transport system permease protein/oligopeptide transport system permease protein n=1 Tax=Nesterenkonia lutea TaxID=272919 RepID=A0ABR9JEX8_9MICC|nr:ABC transporter permease [Nesterenkonia lutea]MBE1524481.1 peptide/nickel transport system permease protein/oligopeptide transport system permease protein [Nesterenkonia lutea]